MLDLFLPTGPLFRLGSGFKRRPKIRARNGVSHLRTEARFVLADENYNQLGNQWMSYGPELHTFEKLNCQEDAAT